ncbi:MAG: prepilin-type N-terminal cleavage/methylation domain-containing protein [Patescibacteria group bacterium]|nr:prepilin-type N-terminal cleavage/methylation domain-containing protein [Patescibacteria group bacterium]MCL5261694.1 prepilin-type N-terminal cleavage/methylation domain-containing protein [Patescibacteria group bacterium]
MQTARSHIKGQSLIEALVALAVGAVMIGGVSTALFLSVRSSASTRQLNNASRLASQELDNVRVLAEANWNAVYLATKYVNPSTTNPHYLSVVTVAGKTSFAINNGTTSSAIDGTTFTKSFYIQNVLRDGSDNIVESGGTDDPSTQKIVVTVTWPTDQSFEIVGYLTRSRNISALFSAWSAGPGLEGPYTVSAAPHGFSSVSSTVDFTPDNGGITLITE